MKKLSFSLLLLCAISIVWGATIVSENFAAFNSETADGTTDISANLDSFLGTIGWTGTKIYKSPGRVKLGTSSAQGVIITPTVNLSANSGAATLTFLLLQYGSDSGKSIQVLHAPDGTTFTQIGSDISIPATANTITVQITGGTASSKIKLQAKLASSNRFYLDDYLITQTGSAVLATVTTVVAASITSSSAVSGGNVTSDGGAAVTAKGVCWNTSSSPTISNYHTSDGTGTGSYVSSLTSLTAETLFYYRAYATNAQGTAYGEEYSFSTSGNAPPAVPIATAATNVGINSFTANWNAATGATSYRLDVSTNSGFTAILTNYNNLTVNTTLQAVSGLNANTQYFYRVRAYNSNDTSTNSNTISVTTLASDPYNGYYNPVLGLSGTDLKTGLHNLIDNNTYSNYDGSKLKIFQVLDNVGGVVRCVYTGQDFTISSSYDGSSNPNTEHTYAQSWFGTSEASIKKADVHHLFVSNSSVNSSRGNLPFDVVANVGTTYPSYNGYVSKRGTNSSGQTVFEPADQHKGNLARALLYFSVRYEMTLSQGGVDMLETLLIWHTADPVDSAELARNTAAYAHQNNRNPFVDHPEYVASIWGGASANTIVQFSPASALVNEADGSVTLSVQIINPSATTATTAQIAITSGSASDVSNFSTQSISFPASSSTNRTITVNITDDSVLEGTETLVFSLINVSGGSSAAIGNYGSFNLEIDDNDIPTPVSTAATNIGYTGFTATWNAASGITDYEFDLSISSSFTSFVGAYENYLVSATNLEISGLAEGSTYYYRVKAIYNDSPGAYSNFITATTNGIIYLDAPVAIAATAVSHEGFTARWNTVTGADSYLLDVYSGTAALTTDLLISEYVMGSSNNKYLEIFNGTGEAIDLSNYQLKEYANGASTPNYTNTLSGILANGACAVYKNSSAALTLPEGVTATSVSSIVFNGDDAIAIYKVSAAAFVDIFGRIGEDPGTAWTSGDLSTLSKTLRRKTTVLSGVTSNPTSGFPTLGTEWDAYLIDTATGLGSHDIGASAPVAGYQDLPVSSNLARVSGLSPATAYSYKVRATNPGDTSEPSNLIQASTTAVVSGTSANTSLAGAATTVLVPSLAGYTNNNLSLDPDTSSSDDYAVNCSSMEGGIKFSIACSNNGALNGSYTLNHNGLGFVPLGVLYRFGASAFTPSSVNATATQTELVISGLAKGSKGTLEIEITQNETLPVELSAFTATINALNKVSLQWVTQSESNLLGYYTLRSQVQELTAAQIISPIITATNTSQQQCYLFVDEELDTDGIYYYWLQNLDLDGGSNYYGPITVNYLLDNNNQTPALPVTTGLTSLYPNPMSTSLRLNYGLAKDGLVSFKIYNIRGQLVKSLSPTAKTKGYHFETWNARDEAGKTCANGLYFIHMQADGYDSIRKTMIVK